MVLLKSMKLQNLLAKNRNIYTNCQATTQLA